MQKVITIPVDSIQKGNDDQSKQRTCYEYADLDKYLQDGYKVIDTFQNENAKTITFLLEKF